MHGQTMFAAEPAAAKRRVVRPRGESQGLRPRQTAKLAAIGRAAAEIAHDFNNTLTAVLGFTDLARALAVEDKLRLHLDEVMRAAVLGKELVERILAFSRTQPRERAPVRVQALVQEALALLAAAVPPQVRLDQVLDAEHATVTADPIQLHRIVMNLCTNALYAVGQSGVVQVGLERIQVAAPRTLSHGSLARGAYVRLAVSDTGCGMAPAVLERLFEPFFTTKGADRGTGLGLSLVGSIVTELRGAIDVSSAVGLGSTFTVWLPVARDDEGAST